MVHLLRIVVYIVILIVVMKILGHIESKNHEPYGWRTDTIFITSLISVMAFGIASGIELFEIAKIALNMLKNH